MLMRLVPLLGGFYRVVFVPSLCRPVLLGAAWSIAGSLRFGILVFLLAAVVFVFLASC